MKNTLSISVLMLFAYSCRPPLYIPNTTNVPTLKEKGDIDASYTLGTNGHDLQGNYAITNNWGVMLNGSYGNSKSDSSASFNRHEFIEIGGGYTINLNEDKLNENKVLFSAFGGYGFGSSSGLYAYSIGNSMYSHQTNGTYTRAFIQPSIGYSTNNVDIFFTLRSTYVNVNKIKNELEQSLLNDEYLDDFGNLVKRKNSNIFYEPTLTIRAGGEQVKGFLQFGFSKGLTPNYQTIFRQRPIIFIIGLHADLNVLK